VPDDVPRTVTVPPGELEETRLVCLDRLAGAVSSLDAGRSEATRLLPAEMTSAVQAQMDELRAKLTAGMQAVRSASTVDGVVDAYRVAVGATMNFAGQTFQTAGTLLASPGYAYRKEVGKAIGMTARAVGSMIGDVLGAAASASGLTTLLLLAAGVWALSEYGKRPAE